MGKMQNHVKYKLHRQQFFDDLTMNTSTYCTLETYLLLHHDNNI